MKDILVLAPLIIAFAVVITVHVAISARLALRSRPRWRGIVALVVPPLAPIWAFREGWHRSAITWIAAIVVYIISLIAGRF